MTADAASPEDLNVNKVTGIGDTSLKGLNVKLSVMQNSLGFITNDPNGKVENKK